MEIEISRVSESDIDDVYRQYRTTPVRQIARKLNKVELRFSSECINLTQAG